MLFDDESVKASCGPVDEAAWSTHLGVEVPMPRLLAEAVKMASVSVDEVANLSVLADSVAQPNAPVDHWMKLDPVQVVKPNPLILVPKRLVLLAVVVKSEVEVALVVVEFNPVKF